MHKSKLLVCLASLHLAVFISSAAHADHSWNNYHWASISTPFTLQIIDSVSEEWDGELTEAISQWSQSIILDPAITSDDDKLTVRKECLMAAGQLRVCNAKYGLTGWLGHAVIGFDQRGHIDKARARLNDSYSQFWNTVSKNHVMCHELGHVFGLAHTSQDGSSQQSCMDLSYQDVFSQWPNRHDFVQIISLYAQKHFYNSYYDGSGMVAINDSTEPLKGERIFRSSRHEIWLAPRDDGGSWLHYILLAPEGE